MSSYTLVPNCTIDDAAAILKTNVSARWNTLWWRAYFPGQSSEEICKISEPRMAGNLLLGQPIRRHQKVIDSKTGEVVAYARWYMPDSHTSEWAEAQLATVDDSETTKHQDMRTNTPLAYRKEMQQVFNKKSDEMRANLDPEFSKNAMGKSFFILNLVHANQKLRTQLHLCSPRPPSSRHCQHAPAVGHRRSQQA